MRALLMWRKKIEPTIIPNCLCFTANTAGSTIALNKIWNPTAVNLETTRDWITWNDYTFWDIITLSHAWDAVWFRNKSTTTTWFSLVIINRYYQFAMTWSISCNWSVNYLINKNDSTTLIETYNNLFLDCSSLTKAPELPATTLSVYCYTCMFSGCTNLITAPILPATNLTDSCYYRMFYNCSSLTIPPELPATTLTVAWYAGMFEWCTSLITAPRLPATVLWIGCYNDMFYWCTSLTSLPELPATNLTNTCYYRMFHWCTQIKLSTIQTWAYQTPYRIPNTWTWIAWNFSLDDMFKNTWWTFTWTPTINTTYYTSNALF